MKQFIYILTLNEKYRDLKNWTEETYRTMESHFNYLKEKFAQGVMKHVGRTDLDFADNDLHGYAIFETTDEETASVIMNSDPAVSDAVMSAKLLPYIIVFH